MSVRAAIAIGKIGMQRKQYAPISTFVIVGMVSTTAGIVFDIYAICDRRHIRVGQLIAKMSGIIFGEPVKLRQWYRHRSQKCDNRLV